MQTKQANNWYVHNVRWIVTGLFILALMNFIAAIFGTIPWVNLFAGCMCLWSAYENYRNMKKIKEGAWRE